MFFQDYTESFSNLIPLLDITYWYLVDYIEKYIL